MPGDACRTQRRGEVFGYRAGMVVEPKRASEWTVHGEQVVDDTRRAVLSIAEVELPDGVRFEQYVLRVPSAAMVVVLDGEQRVLMLWRHRFILNRWVWELPGGYLDPAEEPVTCAAREVEEETGWRPRSMEKLISFQPMVGNIDQERYLPCSRRGLHRRSPRHQRGREHRLDPPRRSPAVHQRRHDRRRWLHIRPTVSALAESDRQPLKTCSPAMKAPAEALAGGAVTRGCATRQVPEDDRRMT